MKTNLSVLFVSLIIFILSATSPINLFGQQSWLDIKNSYSPDAKYFGQWEMDSFKSFTKEKGGIYIKKLSLKNDTSYFEKIRGMIDRYPPFQKINYGLGSITGFQTISIGTVKMEVHSVNLDTAIIENALYIITNTHGIFRLLIFLDDNKSRLKPDFGELMVLEILENDANKDILRLASNTYKSVYSLYKIKSSNKTNFKPLNKNDSTSLNLFGFKGSVKSYITQRYSSKKISNRTYFFNKLIYIDIKQFKKNGDLEKYKVIRESWKDEIRIIEYFVEGNLENMVHKANLNLKSKMDMDSIRIITQKSKRISKAYRNGILRVESESEIVNNRIIKRTDTQGSTNWYTDISYDKNGEVLSVISYSEKGKPEISEYYHILNYDKHGNWTKRIIFADKFLSRDKYIEERKLEYYK